MEMNHFDALAEPNVYIISVGPIQLACGSRSLFATDASHATHYRILLLPIFWRDFRGGMRIRAAVCVVRVGAFPLAITCSNLQRGY